MDFSDSLISSTVDSVMGSDNLPTEPAPAVDVKNEQTALPANDGMFNFTPDLIDSTVDDAFTPPGTMESLGNAAARGIADIPQIGAGAIAGTAKILDQVAPSETAKNIAAWGDEAKANIENAKILAPIRDTGVSGALSHGVETTVMSMGAMLPGLAAAVGTGGTGFLPLAIGMASGSPAFGLDQYNTTLERAKKKYLAQGFSPEEATSKAQLPAAIDGVSTVGSLLAADVISAGLLGSGLKFGTKVAEKSLQELLSTNVLGQSVKKGTAVTAATMLTQSINAGVQTMTDMKTGGDRSISDILTDQRYWDNVEKQLGPIAVSSAIFGALAAGGHAAISGKNLDIIKDGKADPKARAMVAQTIGKELSKKNETLGKVWLSNAAVAIGTQADIDPNVPLNKMGAIKMPDVSDLGVPQQGVEGDVFHKVPRRVPQPDISRDLNTKQEGVQTDIFAKQKEQAQEWENYLKDLALRKGKAFQPILDKEEADRQKLAEQDIRRSEADVLPVGSPGRPDASYIGDINPSQTPAQPPAATETPSQGAEVGPYTEAGLKQGIQPIKGENADVFAGVKKTGPAEQFEGVINDSTPKDQIDNILSREGWIIPKEVFTDTIKPEDSKPVEHDINYEHQRAEEYAKRTGEKHYVIARQISPDTRPSFMTVAAKDLQSVLNSSGSLDEMAVVYGSKSQNTEWQSSLTPDERAELEDLHYKSVATQGREKGYKPYKLSKKQQNRLDELRKKAVLQPKQEATGESPIADGTIYKKNGDPFATEKSANLALKAKRLTDTHKVVDVDGGFALTPVVKDSLTTDEPLPPLNELNPSGSVFADYNIENRVKAPLGENMTTLDRTSGGSPEDIITVYRGVSDKHHAISPGDFVTTNKQLARDYSGTGHVIEKQVLKGDVLDDIIDSGGEEYIYRPGAYKELSATPEIKNEQPTPDTATRIDQIKAEGNSLRTKLAEIPEIPQRPDILTQEYIENKYKDILGIDVEYDNLSDKFDPEHITIDDIRREIDNSDNVDLTKKSLKAHIADKVGDLIETSRYDSTEDGRRYEDYLDGLIREVNEYHKPVKTDLPSTETVVGQPKKGDIYNIIVAGKRKFAIRGDNPKGFGDKVFDTEQEAQDYIRETKNRDEANALSRQRQTEKQAELDDVDGFTDNMSPMGAKRVRNILNKNVSANGTLMSRKQLIRKLVEDGMTIDSSRGERRLINSDGVFHDKKSLTKTGMDYAEYLIAKKQADLPSVETVTPPSGETAGVVPPLTWMDDARNRGIRFKDLTPEQQKKAKAMYQKETGDIYEEEKGWEGFAYHPETLKILGDDPLSTEEWNKAKREAIPAIKKGYYVKYKSSGAKDGKSSWELVETTHDKGFTTDRIRSLIPHSKITDIRTGTPELGRGEVLLKDGVKVEPKPVPPKKVETVIEDTVDAGLKNVKDNKAANAKLKEQKKYLLKNINQAIVDVRNGRGEGNIVIQIPDDGEFSLPRSEIALTNFRDSVKKRFPETTTKLIKAEGSGLPAQSRLPAISSKKRIALEGVTYTNPYKEGGLTKLKKPGRNEETSGSERWFSDGHYLVRKELAPAKPTNEIDDSRFEATLKPTEEQLKPVAISSDGDAATVILKGKDGYVSVRADYFDPIRKAYPKAEIYKGKDGAPIFFVDKGEPVAAIMPLQDSKVKYDVPRLKEIEADTAFFLPRKKDTLNNKGGIEYDNPTPTDNSRSLQAQIEKYTGEKYSKDAYQEVKVSDDYARVAGKLEKVFDKKIVFFKQTGDDALDFNGVTFKGDPNSIYVNVDGDYHVQTIVGHEVLHTMRRTAPITYKKFLKAALEEMYTDSFEEQHLKLAKQRADAGKEAPTKHEVYEEMLGDFLGDNATDPTFWNKIAARMPESFKTVVNFINRYLNKIKTKMSLEGMGSSSYFRDVEKVQNAAAEALAEFSKKEGEVSETPEASFSPRKVIEATKEAFPDEKESKFNEFKYWIADKNTPLLTVQKTLKVTDPTNVFLKETQRPKVTAARLLDFKKNVRDPLIQDIADAGLEIHDVEAYAHALHAEEANEVLKYRNAKMKLEQLVSLLDKDTHRNAKKPSLPIRKQMDTIRGMKADQPKAYYNLLEKSLTEYADKDGVKEFAEKWHDFASRASGMTNDEANDIIRKYKGVKGIDDIVDKIHEINTKKLEILHDAGLLPDEEYEKIKGSYENYVPLFREGYEDEHASSGAGIQPTGRLVKIRGGSTRKVVDILPNSIEQYEAAVRQAEKAKSQKAFVEMIKKNPNNGIFTVIDVKKAPRLDTHGNLRMYPSANDVANNQMRVMVDGEQKLVEANRDNENAMRALRVLKGQGNFPAIPVLSTFNRYLAEVNTSFAPEFMLSNPIRDMFTAMINLQDTPLAGHTFEMMKKVPHAMRAMWHYEMGHEIDPEMKDYIERFRKSGGEISWADVHGDTKSLAKAMERDLQYAKGNRPVRAKLKRVGAIIEHTNTAIENGTRLAAFITGIKNDMTDERAGQLASDLTVDFSKKGAAGPLVNSLYLFANANIQGTARVFRAMSNRKVQGIAAGIITASMLNGMYNAGAGDDDDGIPYIEKVPEYLRERNMNFIIPGTNGKMINVPLPWGYNVFWNFGQELARMMTEKNYKVTDGGERMTSSILNAFNPVASGTLLQTVSPTITDPMVSAYENKTWYGSPLMPPENPFGPKKPDSQRAWKSTRPQFKYVAEVLNRLSGGDKYKPGMVDVSPETLEMLAQTIGGSMVRTYSDIADIPLKLLDKEHDMQIRDVPFVRRLAGEPDKRFDSTKYYDTLNEISILKSRLDDADTPAERSKILLDKDNQRLKAIMPLQKSTAKRIKALKKKIKGMKALNADPRAIKKVEDEIDNTMKQFNKAYREGNVATSLPRGRYKTGYHTGYKTGHYRTGY